MELFLLLLLLHLCFEPECASTSSEETIVFIVVKAPLDFQSELVISNLQGFGGGCVLDDEIVISCQCDLGYK